MITHLLVTLLLIAHGPTFVLIISGPMLRRMLQAESRVVSPVYLSIHPLKDITRTSYNPFSPQNALNLFSMISLVPLMPTSHNGHQYTLILIDHFTKWPEVVPLKEISAPTIARAILDHWICRYVIMTRLHSDGTSNVHASAMQKVAKILATGKSKSSYLH